MLTMSDPTIAFRVREHDDPAIEVRVNFGVFAGRGATPAEIDDLARELHVGLAAFTIVSEERHEFGGAVEASVHQVLIEVERSEIGDDVDAAYEQIVATAGRWAEACFASRQSPI